MLNEIGRQLREIKENLKVGEEDEDQRAYIQKINDLFQPIESLLQHQHHKKASITHLSEHTKAKK